MTHAALAKTLRRRQLRAAPGARAKVHALSDARLLDAYLVCRRCGGELFADRAASVRNAVDTSEFLTLCELALASHRCANRN